MKVKSIFLGISLLILSSNYVSAQIPLEIGNRWDFIDHEWDASGYSKLDTLVLNIYSDTLINNQKYYRINDNPWIHDFIRTDTVGVYFYDIPNNKEWLFFKFDLQINEFIENGYHLLSQDSSNYIKVYKVLDDTTVIFKQAIRRIRFSVVRGLDNAYSITISPKFGFIDIDASNIIFNKNIYLSGCKISGTVYGILTSINDEKQLPLTYALFQNYPNPFNPSTAIGYQLSANSFITLNVYDILGRRVKTLVNKQQGPGNYNVQFYGDNLTSGIYFYRIKVYASSRAGSFSSTKKMILLR